MERKVAEKNSVENGIGLTQNTIISNLIPKMLCFGNGPVIMVVSVINPQR